MHRVCMAFNACGLSTSPCPDPYLRQLSHQCAASNAPLGALHCHPAGVVGLNVARSLTWRQRMQVAGTEMGVTEPEATFSACFGGAFLMWHPMKYAAMLAEKMEQHGTSAWLVNTGCAPQAPACLCFPRGAQSAALLPSVSSEAKRLPRQTTADVAASM